MSLGKVPMKAGGGAKRNATIELGTQVSTATQRAATTTRHRHWETQWRYLPTCKLTMASQEGGEGQTFAQMHKYELEFFWMFTYTTSSAGS